MTRRTIINCDNCGAEEPFHQHARRITTTINGAEDEGLVALGLPCEFDLCGFCASRMRLALSDARDGVRGDQ